MRVAGLELGTVAVVGAGLPCADLKTGREGCGGYRNRDQHRYNTHLPPHKQRGDNRMGTKLFDMSGLRYGRLTVVRRAESLAGSSARWHCLCDCGQERVIEGKCMRLGRTVSCGCHKREKATTHGLSKSREFSSWQNMKTRCLVPTNKDYKYYGARGITVCDEWVNSFETFLRDMGPRPINTTLERKENDGPYAHWNCTWATSTQQQSNKRDTVRIEHDGKNLTLDEWAEELGIRRETIRLRRRRGEPAERILSPVSLKWGGTIKGAA